MEPNGRTKSRKEYSNILKYLEDFDPDLHFIISKYCLEFLFNLKGKPGLTFIWPHPAVNKEYRKKLSEYNNGNEEQREVAEDMIKSLVVVDNIKNAEQFRAKADDIPNALGQRIEINLQKSSMNTVRLPNDAKIELDKTFAGLTKKNNLNVFILSRGEIPLDSPPATYKYVKAKSSTRKKAKESDQNNGKDYDVFAIEQKKMNNSFRQKIASEVENKYIAECAAFGRAKTGNNAYISAVFSLINYIYKYCAKDTVEKVLASRIIPLLSFENIDFYIIFEPFIQFHADGSVYTDYLVPLDILLSWHKVKPSFDHKKVLDIIDSLLSGGKHPGTSAIFSDPLSVADAIEPIRHSIMTGHAREISAKINNKYSAIMSKNAIEGIKNIFPADIYNYYCNFPGGKLLLDEIRYRGYVLFSMLESSPEFNIHVFRDILIDISEYFVRAKSILLDPNTLKYSVDPSNKIREIRSFVNSGFFLHFPFSSSAFEEFAEKYDISDEPSPDADAIWIPMNIISIRKIFDKRKSKSDEKEMKKNAYIAAKLLREIRSSNVVDIDDDLINKLEQLDLDTKSADPVRKNGM